MRRRSVLATGLAMAGALAAGARAAEPDLVTVGGVRLPTNAPLFIAADKGHFARQGIRVAFSWFTAAASVFSAVVSGDVDVGSTSTTAATWNLAARGGFRIIGGTTRDAPHFPLNAVMASNKAWDAGFTAVDRLAGRRFAMTTAGSSFHYDIGVMARKYGVPLAGVPLVPLENFGNIVAALQTGQVDGALLPPVLARRMIDAGTAHFLAWSGDEVPLQSGIVVASPQTIARRHDVLARFMRAYVEGAAEYNRAFNQVDASGAPVRSADRDALLDIIARGADIRPAEVEAQAAFVIPDLRPDRADIARQIAFWQEAGMVSKAAGSDALFDLSLLPPAPGD